MAANNYSANMTNENQSYTFNGTPAFYPKCTTEQQSSSGYANNRVVSVGLSGPGTHLEETTPAIPPPGIKARGRGRRKQRKKIPCPENLMGETLKHDPISEPDLRNMNEGVLIPGMQEEIPELLYQGNVVAEEPSSLENQLLFNSNTLDQILSYKKMMLLQSPDVVEFLKKQQSSNNNRK